MLLTTTKFIPMIRNTRTKTFCIKYSTKIKTILTLGDANVIKDKSRHYFLNKALTLDVEYTYS